MSYGMHDYLVTKAMQNYGLRKEADEMGHGFFDAGEDGISGQHYTQLGEAGQEAVDNIKAANKAAINNSKRVKAARRLIDRLKKSNKKLALAAGIGGPVAGLLGFGGGAAAGRATAPTMGYTGTAIGASAGIPTAVAAALMSEKGNKLKNALLYGSLASLLGAGAGYAYDRYNA